MIDSFNLKLNNEKRQEVYMKTKVIMKRELFGKEISQDSQNEFFSATDLVMAGNKWRIENGLPFFNLNSWIDTKGTKEFMHELEKEFGKVKINSKGKNHHTWVHPYLFIDIALAINPKLKVKVYDWIYDALIKYRNKSGDSYKKMAGALYFSLSNKSEFRDTLIDYANRIKFECGVSDWQTATEKQLQLRDKIHDYISMLSDIIREKNNLFDVAVKKAKDE